jgi:hypothetical protein
VHDSIYYSYEDESNKSGNHIANNTKEKISCKEKVGVCISSKKIRIYIIMRGHQNNSLHTIPYNKILSKVPKVLVIKKLIISNSQIQMRKQS